MRRIIWILAIVLVIVFVFWRNYQYSRREFLRGNEIYLIDRFKNDFIVRSHLTIPLKSVPAEKLGNRWQRVASFQSATVWTTNSEDLIVETSTPVRLTCNGKELKRDQNLLRADVQPDHWTFYQDEILLTTSAQGGPKNANCLLHYQTYLESKPQKITGEDLKIPQEENPQSPLILSLAYPMIRRALPDSILRRNGKNLPDSDWDYAFPHPALLFQSSVLGVFNMFSISNVYAKETYVREGLANLCVTAKADLAGSEFPRIRIYIDKKRMGQIEVKNADTERYCSTVVRIPEGNHLFELKFENDFYDRNTKADRNIGIQKIEIEYLPSVVIRNSSPDQRFTIDYWTTAATSQVYYSNFIFEQTRNSEWINPISTETMTSNELRRSLVLGSGDETVFPVEVPKSGLLEFGYSLPSAKPGAAVKLRVSLHRAFHLPETIFKKRSPFFW